MKSSRVEIKVYKEFLDRLLSFASNDGLAKQEHFGIYGSNRLGISTPVLRNMAKGIRDHTLALYLWNTGILEARLLAGMVDEIDKVTRSQMETWVSDFDNWGLCDGTCLDLFYRTPFAVECALDWVKREEEYVRRAGFVLMAVFAIHKEDLPDEVFNQFFPFMVQYAVDERNFVCKAVNWALRQIGKNRPSLLEKAMETAQNIGQLDSSSARWIAGDALRELKQHKIKQKAV